jgi:hypothetical protein
VFVEFDTNSIVVAHPRRPFNPALSGKLHGRVASVRSAGRLGLPSRFPRAFLGFMDHNLLDLFVKVTYPHLWKSLCVTPLFLVAPAKDIRAVVGQPWNVFCVVTS